MSESQETVVAQPQAQPHPGEEIASVAVAPQDTDTGTQTAPVRERPARVRRRVPKQDAELAQAREFARQALVDSVGPHDVGEHVGIDVHEDRLLTHLFDCTAAGYPGWTWYATVARAPRTKVITVCETGLISGDNSLLAPEWVPWEERMQAVKEQEELHAEDHAYPGSHAPEADRETEAVHTTGEEREPSTASNEHEDALTETEKPRSVPEEDVTEDHDNAPRSPSCSTQDVAQADGDTAPTALTSATAGRSRTRRSRGNRRASASGRTSSPRHEAVNASNDPSAD